MENTQLSEITNSKNKVVIKRWRFKKYLIEIFLFISIVMVFTSCAGDGDFHVESPSCASIQIIESPPSESIQIDDTLNSGEIQTGLDGKADVVYFRSLVQLIETENIYSYVDASQLPPEAIQCMEAAEVYSYKNVDQLTPEIALELVIGTLLSESPDLQVFLVPDIACEEGESHYYYMFRQEWLNDWQLRTLVLDCVGEEPDYYVIELYEIIIDGLQNIDSHQWITRRYNVYKHDALIFSLSPYLD